MRRTPLRPAAAGRRRSIAHGLAAVMLLAVAATPAAAAGEGSPLIEAARRGDTAAIRQALARKADVNATAGDGSTALLWAAYRDDGAAAEALLRAGANANAANDLRYTPLFAAAENGSVAMTRRLLQAGGDANAALLSGETVLMTAARTGNAEVVSALLGAGAKTGPAEQTRGQTALMWAVAQRHPAAVRALVRAGADVSARSKTYSQLVKTTLQATNPAYIVEIQQGGYTPLLFAARAGDVESARLLVEAGADVNDAAPVGTSALTVAAHSGHGGVAAFLLEAGAEPNHAAAGYTALHAALLHRDETLVRQLLAKGADANAPIRQATPTRRDSVDYYLDPSYVGATPLWLAARFNMPGIARLLLAHGADARRVHAPDYFVGEGPARPKDAPPSDEPDRRRVEEGQVSAVMAALGLGGRQPLFSADLLGRLSETARGAARRSGTSEADVLDIVTAIVEAGAPLDVANAEGVTALHAAAVHDYASVVAYLIAKGAPLNATNKRGETPLASATASESDAAAALLRSAAAK